MNEFQASTAQLTVKAAEDDAHSIEAERSCWCNSDEQRYLMMGGVVIGPSISMTVTRRIFESRRTDCEYRYLQLSISVTLKRYGRMTRAEELGGPAYLCVLPVRDHAFAVS